MTQFFGAGNDLEYPVWKAYSDGIELRYGRPPWSMGRLLGFYGGRGNEQYFRLDRFYAEN